MILGQILLSKSLETRSAVGTNRPESAPHLLQVENINTNKLNAPLLGGGGILRKREAGTQKMDMDD